MIFKLLIKKLCKFYQAKTYSTYEIQLLSHIEDSAHYYKLQWFSIKWIPGLLDCTDDVSFLTGWETFFGSECEMKKNTCRHAKWLTCK